MSGLLLSASSLVVAALALIVERAVGYPPALHRLIGHPVVWTGALIAALDRALNGPGRTPPSLRGVIALALVLAAAAALAVPLALALRALPGGYVPEAVLAASLLAQKELGARVATVAEALAGSLAGGRAAVAHLVGRDPDRLDEAGVARAAVESLAENASDGVVAPLFWLLVGGLPGIALYKAVNTADSMIGYRSERYRAFGRAAARLDDVVNWLPARLTGLLIALAAAIGGGDAAGAWAAMRRDARAHVSPNAGWPEAAMAGALGLRLGGPRVYGAVADNGAWLGEGRADLGPADITRALALYRGALDLLIALVAVPAIIVAVGA